MTSLDIFNVPHLPVRTRGEPAAPKAGGIPRARSVAFGISIVAGIWTLAIPIIAFRLAQFRQDVVTPGVALAISVGAIALATVAFVVAHFVRDDDASGVPVAGQRAN